MKSYEVVKFANKPQANKVVSKKFGDVKKISLFERSEFEIFSRRAFCVLEGRAPARAMGLGGRFKEGVRGLARPWLLLLINLIKAKLLKYFSLNPLSRLVFCMEQGMGFFSIGSSQVVFIYLLYHWVFVRFSYFFVSIYFVKGFLSL